MLILNFRGASQSNYFVGISYQNLMPYVEANKPNRFWRIDAAVVPRSSLYLNRSDQQKTGGGSPQRGAGAHAPH